MTTRTRWPEVLTASPMPPGPPHHRKTEEPVVHEAQLIEEFDKLEKSD